MATKTKPTDVTPLVFDLDLPDTTLAGMINRRSAEATAHWEKLYHLKRIREDNKKLYTSEYVQKQIRDERYEEIFSDNKLFTSVRTILPFITSRLTQPEIVPADDDSLSLQFAKDFEKILVEIGENEYARDKVKLALQDLLTGQRVGVLKWVYNPHKDKLELEYCSPDSIIVGKRSRLHEEPDFVQHTQERSIGDLIRQFPDKEEAIFRQFEISKAVPSQLEQIKKITENWLYLEANGSLKLGIVWMYESGLLLGKMSDPNWIDGGKNALDEHMMPFIFFNFLNDGSGYIDNTSFIEQAQYNQKNYDKRGSTIAENAAYAGIGVPVFGKGAVKEETASKVRFSPVQRVLLDTEDVTKSFTTWTAGQLPNFIFEDKMDAKQSVLDIFGTNSIQQGNTPQSGSKNATLGQDVLLRNQAEGRQQELIDCVDNGMSRFFQIESQMVYRYFDSPKYYNFIGEDGEFEHLMISQQKLAKNLGISIKIKSGSSLPVDRSQKIATAIELMKFQRIGTLRLYKELGIDDPEQTYKEFLREHLLPFGELGEMTKEIFSREAEEDLYLVIGGKQPKEREDMTQDYLTYLNEFLLTQKYEQLPQAAQVRVSKYVAEIIAQAQRKVLKMQTQQPVLPSDGGQLPPIRPKISLSGKDLQPDVMAQIVQNAGYQPSQLTNMEMAAGIMSAPTERIMIDGNPLVPGQASTPGNHTPASLPPSQPQPQLPVPAVPPTPSRVKK